MSRGVSDNRPKTGIEAWVQAFGRVYGLSAEQQRRRAVFEANVETIAKHNREADAGCESYRLGINDLTPAEFRSRFSRLGHSPNS